MALLQELGQRNLRELDVMFHELPDARVLEDLQPAVRESRGLAGVEHDMPRGGVPVQQQALTDVQRGDSIT